jgi:hypothetical protein
MFNKNSFTKNDYILNCDHLNKYNLKTIYSLPKILSISINLPLKNIIDSSENSSIIKKYKLKSFFYLYALSSFFPLIQSNFLKVDRNTENKLNLSLKIQYLNQLEINSFLRVLFIENWKKISKSDFKFYDIKNLKVLIDEKKSMFSVVVPIYFFFELNEMFINLFPNLNSKEFYFTITVILKKDSKILDFKTYIQNLQLFWIGC